MVPNGPGSRSRITPSRPEVMALCVTSRTSCQGFAHLAGCACLGGSAGAAQVGRVVFPAGDQVGAGFTYRLAAGTVESSRIEDGAPISCAFWFLAETGSAAGLRRCTC